MGQNPSNIKEQLRRAILDAELSRYRLAQLTGVSQATLSLFVNGHCSMTMDNAAKIAAVLGMELTPARQTRKGR